MASKRMFARSVVCDDDAFLDLSRSARLLYFDLGMAADDDGFISSPKKILRITGATAEDLEELADEGFIIPFYEGKLYLITDWLRNNNIRADRYHPENQRQELAAIRVDSFGRYRLGEEGMTVAEYRSKQSQSNKKKSSPEDLY